MTLLWFYEPLTFEINFSFDRSNLFFSQRIKQAVVTVGLRLIYVNEVFESDLCKLRA